MKKKPKLTSKKKPMSLPTKCSTQKNINGRSDPRVMTPNLWVTERNGDFEYRLQAQNLSLGGVFLAGRIKGSEMTSELSLILPSGSIVVNAQAVYDQVSDKGIGIGFRFVNLAPQQLRVLKTYLRNFN